MSDKGLVTRQDWAERYGVPWRFFRAIPVSVFSAATEDARLCWVAAHHFDERSKLHTARKRASLARLANLPKSPHCPTCGQAIVEGVGGLMLHTEARRVKCTK